MLIIVLGAWQMIRTKTTPESKAVIALSRLNMYIQFIDWNRLKKEKEEEGGGTI